MNKPFPRAIYIDVSPIDWHLLSEQIATLCVLKINATIPEKYEDEQPPEVVALEGVLNLLRNIREAAIREGSATTEEVYGNKNTPDKDD